MTGDANDGQLFLQTNFWASRRRYQRYSRRPGSPNRRRPTARYVIADSFSLALRCTDCMIGFSPKIVSFDQFCRHVEKQLCQIGQLEVGQFPMTRREVSRGGQSCGLYFCIHGPRSVKLTAVYDHRKRAAIYYGTDGVRQRQESIGVKLPSPPRRSA